MNSKLSATKIRDFLRVLGPWPRHAPESDLQSSLVPNDLSEILIDCFLLRETGTCGMVVVLLTAWRGEERTRNLSIQDEDLGQLLCDVLRLRIGEPICGIGDVSTDVAQKSEEQPPHQPLLSNRLGPG